MVFPSPHLARFLHHSTHHRKGWGSGAQMQKSNFAPGILAIMDVLSGSVERITYYNPENGYTVLRLRPEVSRGHRTPGLSYDGLATVVGNLPEVSPGEHLRLQGRWDTHPKHGTQFKVEVCEQTLPATVAGIQGYLGSGLIRGIGPRMAERIVGRFTEETFEIIERHPERLREVPGIGPDRAGRITAAWEEQKQVKEIMVFLHGHGVSTNLAVKIYKAYGDSALETVQKNPYQLERDIYGVGFKTADRIAQALGLPAEHPSRIEAGIVFALNEMVDEGHVYAPRDLLAGRANELLGVQAGLIAPALERLAGDERIRAELLPARGGKGAPGTKQLSVSQAADTAPVIYLTPLYFAEKGVADRLRALAGAAVPRSPAPACPDGQSRVAQAQAGREPAGASQFPVSDQDLSEEQQAAVRMALSHAVSILTGGPGTGKTTCLKALIASLESEQQRYALASPTGRAAKRLSEATGRPARTIHRLLEFSPVEGFKHNEQNPLETDFLVVDEASMLDLLLTNNLLKAVRPGTQVLFVGDVDQLPSVGAGDVLRDLIASGIAPVARLTAIFRQAAGSQIITNAHRINQGKLPVFSQGSGDFFLFPAEDAAAAADWIVEVVTERIPRKFGFDGMRDTQVLAPIYRGPAGVGALNERLQEKLNPPAANKAERRLFGTLFRAGDKVMQTQNNYDKDIFNGDIGFVRSIDLVEQVLRADFDGRLVSYDWSDADQLTLAYALTVHKCIAGYERVWTQDGMICIRDYLGGFVKTGLGEDELSSPSLASGVKKLVRVVTASGVSIDVSEDHPILIVDENGHRFEKAEHILPGTILPLSRRALYKATEPSLSEFQRDLPRSRLSLNIPQMLDEELSWWLGVTVGDGSYRDRRDGTIDISNMDVEILSEWRRISESYGLNVGQYEMRDNKATRLYVVSWAYRRFLENMGLGFEKAAMKRVPEIIWKASDKSRAAFVRGLMDTDGSVGSQVRLTTACLDLARDIQQILLSLGIFSYIKSQGLRHHKVVISGTSIGDFQSLVGLSVRHKAERLARLGAKPSQKTNKDNIPFSELLLQKLDDEIRRTAGRTKGRKGKAIYPKEIRHFIGQIKRGQSRLSYIHLSKMVDLISKRGGNVPIEASDLLHRHWYFDSVCKIVPLSNADVFDLRVANQHAFVCNGIIAHNCQGSEFPVVVMPLVTQHYTMLQRNLLYTAITRARDLCVLVGSRRATSMAVRNNKVARRFSALEWRLRKGGGAAIE
jgi:exodeoxyribonuclease V alpha subunit